MRLDHTARELEFRTGVKKGMWLMLAASVATNMFLGVMAMTNKSSHRETLVPPEITKSFWVDGEKVAPEYLEQMGKFILDLALNNTPINCDLNRTALLKYVGSGSYAAINSQQAANCKIIATSRISTFFSASNVAIKNSTKEVMFVGAKSRWLNDKKLPDKQMAYRIKFGYSGGRIYVMELVEVDIRAADPFSADAVKKDVIEQMQTELATAQAEQEAQPAAPAASSPASAPKGN